MAERSKEIPSRFSDEATGSRKTPFNRRAWDRFRNALLKQRRLEAAQLDVALCELCRMEGKAYRAQAVDGHHRLARRDRPDLVHDPANIQFLCRAHHSIITKWEEVPRIPHRTVVVGAPGVGKTHYVAQRAMPGDLVWDADVVASERGWTAYPRTEWQVDQLHNLRTQFIERAKTTDLAVWAIVRWPRTAYKLAMDLHAAVVELHSRPNK